MAQRIDRDSTLDSEQPFDDSLARPKSPGKSTMTSRLVGRPLTTAPTFTPAQHVQFAARRAVLRADDCDPFADTLVGPYLGASGLLPPTRPTHDGPHAVAAAGVGGTGGALPHGAAIQAAFGHHDLSAVRVHTDGDAAHATQSLGALAYATGNDIAFASSAPDLHTAAHEAAHVIQQRGGVQLAGGLGREGDPYEQHADAVADAVVRGESAAALIDEMAGSGGNSGALAPIQRQSVASSGGGEVVSGTHLGPASDAAALGEAMKRLTVARDKAREVERKLRAGELTASAAASAIVPMLSASEQALLDIDVHARAMRPRTPLDLARGASSPPASKAEQAGHLRQADRDLATTVPILDELAASVLAVAAALDDGDPGLGPMAKTLQRVERAGARFGWSIPVTVDGARQRKYAAEACPPGENDISPRACHLAEGQRARYQADLGRALTRLVSTFFETCKNEGAVLQKAIDADQRLAQLVSIFVTELLLAAVTGGVSAIAAPAVADGEKLAHDAATTLPLAAQTVSLPATTLADGVKAASAAVPTPLSAGAKDLLPVEEFRKIFTKTATGRLPKALAGGTGEGHQQETIAALDALAADFKHRVEAAEDMMRSLDDEELVGMTQAVQHMSDEDVRAHVHAFAKAYVNEAAPIGKDNPLSEHVIGRELPMSSTYRAARVAMPGGRTRLALIEVVADVGPGAMLRKSARAGLVGMDRIVGDEADSMSEGLAHRAQQDAWIASDTTELHFVRWINDPRMQALAEADAIDVPATAIRELPLTALMPANE